MTVSSPIGSPHQDICGKAQSCLPTSCQNSNFYLYKFVQQSCALCSIYVVNKCIVFGHQQWCAVFVRQSCLPSSCQNGNFYLPMSAIQSCWERTAPTLLTYNWTSSSSSVQSEWIFVKSWTSSRTPASCYIIDHEPWTDFHPKVFFSRDLVHTSLNLNMWKVNKWRNRGIKGI